MFKLETPAGPYEAESFGTLVWMVLKHRTWHWLRREGWRD